MYIFFFVFFFRNRFASNKFSSFLFGRVLWSGRSCSRCCRKLTSRFSLNSSYMQVFTKHTNQRNSFATQRDQKLQHSCTFRWRLSKRSLTTLYICFNFIFGSYIWFRTFWRFIYIHMYVRIFSNTYIHVYQGFFFWLRQHTFTTGVAQLKQKIIIIFEIFTTNLKNFRRAITVI